MHMRTLHVDSAGADAIGANNLHKRRDEVFEAKIQ
jgi:hypothetical protein